MNKYPPLKPIEREEILHQQYPFAYQHYDEAAWSVMIDCWGKPVQWGREHIHIARCFLSILSTLTPETLSFSIIKQKIMEYEGRQGLLSILFFFLVKIKEEYNAEDATMFHRLIDYLEKAGRTYYVLFNKDVNSFDDIAYIRGGRLIHVYVVRCNHSFFKSVIRSVMMETNWGFDGYPNQTRIDNLCGLVNSVLQNYRKVLRIADVDFELMFKLIDEANRKHKQSELSYKYRTLLIKDIIHIFRFLVRLRIMGPYGPILDPNILFIKPTVEFFVSEYVSLDKTFVFPHWMYGKKQNALITLDIPNIYLREAYGRFLGSGKECRVGYAMCRNTLVESLGEFAKNVGSPGHPFNEEVLFRQIKFYVNLFAGNRHRSEAITFVKMFFLSIDKQSNGEFFRKSNCLTYKLLTSRHFETYFEEGYTFRRYSPYDNIIDGEKIIFFISGLDQFRKNYRSEDYIAIDYSCIKNDFYRSIAWQATTSKIGRLYRKSFSYMLREVLPFLLNIKSTQCYPTPSLDVISAWDTLFIAQYYEKKHPASITYNHNVREVRDFLRWCSATKSLMVDSGAELSLKGKKNKSRPTNTPIVPDEHLTLLTDYFIKYARKDSRYGLALILMHLIRITPLRISDVCQLSIDKLYFDDINGTYVSVSSRKSTNGDKSEIVFGAKANEFIRKALSIHDNLVNDCLQDDLKPYLFMYKTLYGAYTLFNSKTLGVLLSAACQDLGLPHYTTKNFRASYMTDAFIQASESGDVNDYLLKLFSYHKRTGTTIENYVNHDEALAILTEHLRRDGDWAKTIYPDEIAALKKVIDTYDMLLNSVEDITVKVKLTAERQYYEEKLKSIQQ